MELCRDSHCPWVEKARAAVTGTFDVSPVAVFPAAVETDIVSPRARCRRDAMRSGSGVRLEEPPELPKTRGRSGGIVQARKDAASRLECLHAQAAIMRSAGRDSCLMLHTECSWCPKPKTSGRRAGCIIAAANGQSSGGSPRRRLPVVERIAAQVRRGRVDTGADRREVERGSTSENGKPSG